MNSHREGLQEISFIADSFNVVFLTHIPVFDNSKINEARRFIHFIDQLYNRKVVLIVYVFIDPR